MPAPRKQTQSSDAAFFAALERGATVVDAARLTGVMRQALYLRRICDPDFNMRWHSIELASKAEHAKAKAESKRVAAHAAAEQKKAEAQAKAADAKADADAKLAGPNAPADAEIEKANADAEKEQEEADADKE